METRSRGRILVIPSHHRGGRPVAVALLAAVGLGVAGPRPIPSTSPPQFPGDLWLRREATRLAGTRASARSPGAADLQVFLIGNPDPAALADLGVRSGLPSGRVRAARVPGDGLERLAAVRGLECIVLARPLRPELDVSVDSVRAGSLRTVNPDGTWSGLTGDSVLVGIVDSGVDPTHEDFRREDGSTRILAYWDQADTTGPPPGIGGFSAYGSEWTGAQILGVNRVWDVEGHGTHVAGIAVGDGSASRVDSLRYRFPGIAPEADIVVVAVDRLLDTGVLDAVHYVFAWAQALGRPAVVNLSLGTQFGPHDGSTPLELGLDALTGPGRLIVAAAGNEGEDRIHAEIQVPAGGSDSATVFVGPYGGGPPLLFFAVDAFYPASCEFEVTVVTPAGRRLGPVRRGELLPDTLTAEGTVFIGHLAYPPFPETIEIGIEVSNVDPDSLDGTAAVAPASGEWRFVVRDRTASPTAGEVDLWVALTSIRDVAGNEPFWLRGYDGSEEIAAPGSGHRTLTVGSFNTKSCWPDSLGTTRCTTVTPESLAAPGRLTFFSSRGPTRDGREKPEVCAPGFVIASARSHDLGPDYATAYRLDRTLQPDGEHFVFTGTSAAAPHLTGALALALEREPGLDPEAARERLRSGARRDEWTGSAAWTPAAGFGKLDITALVGGPVPVRLRELRIVTGIDGNPELTWAASDGDPVVSFRLEGRAPGGGWQVRGRFAGAGPHVFQETREGSAWDYRLWVTVRWGTEESWATASWTAPSPVGVGLPSPNPFREGCRIPVMTSPGSAPGRLRAEVVDVSGRVVRRFDGQIENGDGMIWWDGRNDAGRPAAPGVYWIRIDVGERVAAVRVVKRP